MDQSTLDLNFDDSSNLQLRSTCFFHPQLERELITHRGKTAGAHDKKCGTFQWTSAVQALSVLFLSYAASSDKSKAILSGANGTLAASLDDALSKPPNWLLDMFGVSASGTVIAKRLIKRSNPQRKRPGPVELSINSGILRRQDCRIYLDGELVKDRNHLKGLAAKISTSWDLRQQIIQKKTHLEEEAEKPTARNLLPSYRKHSKLLSIFNNFHLEQEKSGPLPAPFSDPVGRQALRETFKSETLTMLKHTDIFSRRGTNKVEKGILSKDYFLELTGGNNQLISDIDRDLCGSNRIGYGVSEKLIRDHLTPQDPITIAAATGSCSNMAILFYMKYVKGYHLEIDYHFSYAIEIMVKILNRALIPPPDFCVMGIAPAGTLLGHPKQHSYHPIMFLPCMTHRVLAPKKATPSKKPTTTDGAEYIFVQDDPSTSLFYFTDLRDKGDIKVSSQLHLEPYEITEALDSENQDLRAILFAPYYQLNVALKNRQFTDNPALDMSAKESVLFAHEKVYSQPEVIRCFDIAYRDAWLTLRDGGVFLDLVLDLMIEDRDLVTCIKRNTGL